MSAPQALWTWGSPGRAGVLRGGAPCALSGKSLSEGALGEAHALQLIRVAPLLGIEPGLHGECQCPNRLDHPEEVAPLSETNLGLTV